MGVKNTRKKGSNMTDKAKNLNLTEMLARKFAEDTAKLADKAISLSKEAGKLAENAVNTAHFAQADYESICEKRKKGRK
jgi:hypothetical protein